MNWILLIIGGLFEVMFTFCIGKANDAVGSEKWLWYLGFLVSVSISMGAIDQSDQHTASGYCLCGLDRNWRCRDGFDGYFHLQGAC